MLLSGLFFKTASFYGEETELREVHTAHMECLSTNPVPWNGVDSEMYFSFHLGLLGKAVP